MFRNVKAMSNLFLILLLLSSAVIGGIFAYLLVMSSFYSVSPSLAITDVSFKVEDASFFDVTVLNPSYSPSSATITQIVMTREGDETLYNVTMIDPPLPFDLSKGTSQKFRCYRNWGRFAGENVTIHVFAMDFPGATYSTKTPFVKLEAEAVFDSTVSVDYFMLTIRNNQSSEIPLNLTDIWFVTVRLPAESVTPSLETAGALAQGASVTFNCTYHWEGYVNVTVTVKTSQAYEAVYTVSNLPIVGLTMSDVTFDDTNTTRFDVTVRSEFESFHSVEMTKIVAAAENGTQLCETQIIPPTTISPNSSRTFECLWDWNNYRSQSITVTAYSKQGFRCAKTVVTPPDVILKIMEFEFNLTNTGCFNVTVQNALASTSAANITQIVVGVNQTTLVITGNLADPSLPYWWLENGTWKEFNCTWNWASYMGYNATITVNAEGGFQVSRTLVIPFAEIVNVSFGTTAEGVRILTVNVTNALTRDLNVSRIVLVTASGEENLTLIFPSPTLVAGATTTLVCPWDWSQHSGNVTITIVTTEGLEIVKQDVAIPSP